MAHQEPRFDALLANVRRALLDPGDDGCGSTDAGVLTDVETFLEGLSPNRWRLAAPLGTLGTLTDVETGHVVWVCSHHGQYMRHDTPEEAIGCANIRVAETSGLYLPDAEDVARYGLVVRPGAAQLIEVPS